MPIPESLIAGLAQRYRVERELGAGGMATVYLAHDLKHERDVAIKVLHPDLGAALGAERFLTEIKTTAKLQHPHILPLLDSGAANGLLYYVMPYVRGETLRARLERERQLPIPDALLIAREVADALHAAHGLGIVHRDVKPENILLQDGHALVADFGIALAVQSASGQRMTQTGLSLGTPQYMSPEQAMGEKTIDARSDIYALGAVTYEMLTGEAPFTGGSVQAIVSKVIASQPEPLRTVRSTVPVHVEATTLAALAKLPADRPATAKAFADGLVTAAVNTGSVGEGQPARTSKARRQSAPIAWGVTALLGAALAWVLLRPSASSAGEPYAYEITLPVGVAISGEGILSISRDGRTLVMQGVDSAGQSIFTKTLGAGEFARVKGTSGATSGGFVSPDGRWIIAERSGKLTKLPLDGSAPPEAIVDASWGNGVWAPTDTIIYTPSFQSGLMEVSINGGTPKTLTTPDTAAGELGHWWPHLLPDGDHVLFTNYGSNASLWVVSRKSGTRKRLVESATGAHYSARHKLLFFVRARTLFGVPFDADRLEVTGKPVGLVDDIATSAGSASASYAIAENGTLTYLSSKSSMISSVPVLLDRSGRGDPALPTIGQYENPALSPDKQRVALNVTLPGEVTGDIWVFPVGASNGTKITNSPRHDWGPSWLPDGRSLVYTSEDKYYALTTISADGSSSPKTLLNGPIDHDAPRVSADGKTVVYMQSLVKGVRVGVIRLDSSASEGVYPDGGRTIGRPDLSPDNRWLAVVDYEQDKRSVYAQSFPDPTRGRVRVSGAQGDEPLFTRGGREIVYRVGDSVFAVPFDPNAGKAGTPTLLFFGPFASDASIISSRSWDVSRDGETFLMLRETPDRYRRQVNIVLNWLDDAARRVKP